MYYEKTEENVPNYLFICNKCKAVLLNDEDIEKHSQCEDNTENSCKYWNEEYIVKNLDYFKL